MFSERSELKDIENEHAAFSKQVVVMSFKS